MLHPTKPRKTTKKRITPGFPSAEVIGATLGDDHVAVIKFKSMGALTMKFASAEEAMETLQELGVKPS